MFCPYCGKQLKEGEVCDCPESQAARRQEASSVQQDQANDARNMAYTPGDLGGTGNMNAANDAQNGQQQYQQYQQDTYRQQAGSIPQQPNGQYGYNSYRPAQPSAFKRMGQFLKMMFKTPVDAIWYAKNENDYRYQFLFGGVYLIIILLILWGSLSNLLGGSSAFGVGFGVMAVAALCKVIYAFGVWLYNREEGIPFGKALGVTCASTVFESICLLATGLFILAGSVSLVLFFIFLTFLVSVIMQGVVLAVVTENNPNRSFWICLLFNVIIIVILAIIINALARSMVSSLAGDLGSLFSFLGNYE